MWFWFLGTLTQSYLENIVQFDRCGVVIWELIFKGESNYTFIFVPVYFFTIYRVSVEKLKLDIVLYRYNTEE